MLSTTAVAPPPLATAFCRCHSVLAVLCCPVPHMQLLLDPLTSDVLLGHAPTPQFAPRWSSAVTMVSTAAIPPIVHLDAHHWWPTVSSLGKSVWANRCSCVGSPSLRTTGAGLSSTVIYSSIFSSASSGHDFTLVPPTVSSASQLLLTRSVPPAYREWRSRLHTVHRFR